MTIHGDKYDNYRKGLLAGGLPVDQIESAIELMKVVDTKIEAGVCPQCDSKLTRTLDPRQDGPTEIAGKWFNYRCTRSCGWLEDRCEPVGEN
jgi:hypothetical protein